MLEIGKIQKLKINRKTDIGWYLEAKDSEEKEDILLPKSQISEDMETGDEIEVFVYKDSKGKTLATSRKPKLTVGEVGLLKVVQTKEFGAFLDWGLEADLLLPLSQQIGKIKEGEFCLVGLQFNENTGKLSATMNLYDFLSTDSSYKKNDMVHGIVYSINKDIGIFVAVERRYHGLILNKEIYGNYRIGDDIEVRIKSVRDDGKLELSLRKQAYNEIESDAQKIMEKLKLNGGKLLINDNSSPELIKKEFNISKKAFKRAVGRLLKEGAIKITEEGIETSW